MTYLSLCPDYPVVHLQLLMISNPTVWSGIMPDNRVLMYDTYTDYSRLDGRVGVCVMALSRKSGISAVRWHPEGFAYFTPFAPPLHYYYNWIPTFLNFL